MPARSVTFNDGKKVKDEMDWRQRKPEVYDAIIPLQYGELPSVPDTIRFELLHETKYIDSLTSYISGSVCFAFEQQMTFGLNLYVPQGEGAFPVVICADLTWRV